MTTIVYQKHLEILDKTPINDTLNNELHTYRKLC
jgi:hypothetical protein